MIQNIKNFGMAVLFIAAMSGFAALVIETFNQIDMKILENIYDRISCVLFGGKKLTPKEF